METKLTVTKEQIAENMKDVVVRTAEEYGKINEEWIYSS